MENDIKKVSKYLSYILRHKPEEIGLVLDENGWGLISDLISKTTSFNLTLDLLQIVVETNDKQRFAIDPVTEMIRANQGHSIDVDLALAAIEPPEFLLHGSAEKFASSIIENGLKKQNRHHVHLSQTASVAKSVGGRYGKPVLFTVKAKLMFDDGFKFYKTVNHVWLVSDVPAKYLIKHNA
ncbi:RNA 2'-phosphotransferase [Marinicellulosiphila megalodicopiae]|uniref:RNA 2'-phosphotransferase n=1 Tax=Marinicellulosiphila megalodicopiae TaxID=2724896 RepID=UPI003BAF7511